MEQENQGYGDEMEMEMEMDMDMEMEMEMDGGYGDGGYGDGGYGGNSGGGNSTRNRGGTMDQLFPTGAETLQTLGLTSLNLDAINTPIPHGPVLPRQANVAFQSGNLPLALQLQYAHMVVEPKDAQRAYAAMKFNKTFKRPVWQLQLGVSLMVRGEPGADMGVIEPGTGGQKLANNRGGGMGGQDSMMEQEMMSDQGMDQDMMMEQEMMEDMSMDMDMDGQGMEGYGGGGRRAAPAAVIPKNTLNAESRARLKEASGLVATYINDELTKRFQAGQFGVLFNEVPILSEAESQNKKPGNEKSDPTPIATEDFSVDAAPIGMWAPSIYFLGEGDSKSMAETAAKHGLDGHFHFDVMVRPARGTMVQNITRCRLIHPQSGKTIVATKGFDSQESFMSGRTRGVTSDDYVKDQAETMLATFDRHFSLINMPTLPANIAKTRVTSLLSGSDSRNLRNLAEIRFYQSQGLLTEADVEQAFDVIAGDDGLTMLYGSKEERFEVVRRWAEDAVAKHANIDE